MKTHTCLLTRSPLGYKPWAAGTDKYAICYPSLLSLPQSVFILSHWVLTLPSYPFSSIFIPSVTTLTSPSFTFYHLVLVSLSSSDAFLNLLCLMLTVPYHLLLSLHYFCLLSRSPLNLNPLLHISGHLSRFPFSFRFCLYRSLTLFLSCLFHPLLLLILYNPSQCIPL